MSAVCWRVTLCLKILYRPSWEETSVGQRKCVYTFLERTLCGLPLSAILLLVLLLLDAVWEEISWGWASLPVLWDVDTEALDADNSLYSSVQHSLQRQRVFLQRRTVMCSRTFFLVVWNTKAGTMLCTFVQVLTTVMVISDNRRHHKLENNKKMY